MSATERARYIQRNWMSIQNNTADQPGQFLIPKAARESGTLRRAFDLQEVPFSPAGITALETYVDLGKATPDVINILIGVFKTVPWNEVRQQLQFPPGYQRRTLFDADFPPLDIIQFFKLVSPADSPKFDDVMDGQLSSKVHKTFFPRTNLLASLSLLQSFDRDGNQQPLRLYSDLINQKHKIFTLAYALYKELGPKTADEAPGGRNRRKTPIQIRLPGNHFTEVIIERNLTSLSQRTKVKRHLESYANLIQKLATLTGVSIPLEDLREDLLPLITSQLNIGLDLLNSIHILPPDIHGLHLRYFENNNIEQMGPDPADSFFRFNLQGSIVTLRNGQEVFIRNLKQCPMPFQLARSTNYHDPSKPDYIKP